MGDGGLSQEEIDALLNGGGEASAGSAGASDAELTPQEIDAIGEVANISMGTAATTLFSLVNKKVEISTPVVSVAKWDEIVEKYERPCVLVRISYTKGLDGSNVLVLREDDVKVITDLMMGGDGSNTDGDVGEIHLSAISEAMNQMMGSSATSLSSMLERMIDISPPSSDLIDLQETPEGGDIDNFLGDHFVMITFKLLIGDLIDSEIMQLYPIALAKEMCKSIMSNMEIDSASTVNDAAFSEPEPQAPVQEQPQQQVQTQQQVQQQAPPMMDMGMQQQAMMQPPPMAVQQVNVQPAQFQPFAGTYQMPLQPENMLPKVRWS